MDLFRISVCDVEGPHYQLLILGPPALLGNQDGVPIQFLEEQPLLKENEIEGFCCSYVMKIDIDLSWLAERLPIKDYIETQLIGQIPDDRFQVHIVVNN